MIRISPILLVCFALLRSAGQTPASPVTNLDRVSPFVDELTVAIARLDLRDVDVGAAFQTVSKFSINTNQPAAEKERVEAMQKEFEEWLTEFRKAGGRDIYLLFSLSDLGQEPPVSLVVPLEESGDAEALRQLLARTRPFPGECAVKQGCVVVAPAPVLRRLEKPGSARPKDLGQAFAQTPAGLLQAVLVPYAGAPRVMEELMPTLPAILGGGSSSPLARGFRWACFSMGAPPDLTVQLSFQLQTGNDAAALRQVVLSALDAFGAFPEVRQNVPQWDQVREMLAPSVQGDRLVLALGADQIQKLATTLLGPGLEKAREKAGAIASVNNLRQIGLAVHIYAADHADELPPHLAAALSELGSVRPLLNPRETVRAPDDLNQWTYEQQKEWIDRHSPYVYLAPAKTFKEIKNPGNTMLAYEKLPADGASLIPVLFADGSVQLMDQEAFGKLRKPSQDMPR